MRSWHNRKLRSCVRLPLLLFSCAAAFAATVGPDNGSLLVAGGAVEPEIMNRFIELAGGPDASIIVIPTANLPPQLEIVNTLRSRGAKNVTVLHTTDRKIADSEAFVQPLKKAGGVWFTGGRQWRLVDAYLDTRTIREVRAVLDRGGVVGGTSAGASILVCTWSEAPAKQQDLRDGAWLRARLSDSCEAAAIDLTP